MDIYDRLGVKKLINATGTLTHIGSSLMRPEVLEAMTEASEHSGEASRSIPIYWRKSGRKWWQIDS